MEFNIPRSLRVEHEELHEELSRGTKEPGSIGKSARTVAKILHPHFVKEEEYALPPLGLLSPLAEGNPTPDMKKVVRATDRLKAELPRMLEEHRAIVAALKDLIVESKRKHKVQYVRFAEKLTLHAQTEEEVLYPAAILVGEYLKCKLRT